MLGECDGLLRLLKCIICGAAIVLSTIIFAMCLLYVLMYAPLLVAAFGVLVCCAYLGDTFVD